MKVNTMVDLLIPNSYYIKSIVASLNMFSTVDFLFSKNSILFAIAVILFLVIVVYGIFYLFDEHTDKSSEQADDNTTNLLQPSNNTVSTESENNTQPEPDLTQDTTQTTPILRKKNPNNESQSVIIEDILHTFYSGDLTEWSSSVESCPASTSNNIPSIPLSPNVENGNNYVKDIPNDVSPSQSYSGQVPAEVNYYIQQLQSLLQNLQSLLQNQYKEKIDVLEKKVASISKDYNTQVQANERLIKQIGLFVDSIQQVLVTDCDENYKKAYCNNLKTFLRLFFKAGIQKIEPQKGDPFDEETMLPIHITPCPLTSQFIAEGYKEGTRIVLECHNIGLAYNGHVLEIGGNKRVAEVEIIEFVK